MRVCEIVVNAATADSRSGAIVGFLSDWSPGPIAPDAAEKWRVATIASSPAKWFDETVVQRQALERCTRTSLGGRRGFYVERGHALSVQDVEALQACLIAALRRVRTVAEEIGADVLRVEEDAGDEEDGEDEDAKADGW